MQLSPGHAFKRLYQEETLTAGWWRLTPFPLPPFSFFPLSLVHNMPSMHGLPVL